MDSIIKFNNRKVLLSTLWVFFVLNILYADIIGVMEVTFNDIDVSAADNAELIQNILSPGMLLGISVILESAMIMIILARVLKHSANRWSNIIVAIIQALVLTASLFVGSPKMYYIFFATVEFTTLFLIIWYAWKWPKPEVARDDL
jgi:hypothetical protein